MVCSSPASPTLLAARASHIWMEHRDLCAVLEDCFQVLARMVVACDEKSDAVLSMVGEMAVV